MRLLVLFLAILALGKASCTHSSECADVSTCEIGACIAGNCSTVTVCECGDGTLEPPYEECDYAGPLCVDCVRLGACLKWEGGIVTCNDAYHGSDCQTQGGYFLVNGACESTTACCDSEECTMETPAVCFGLNAKPRANKTCSDENVCVAGCCCSSHLLYGKHQGGLNVFLKDDCCMLGGRYLEGVQDCGYLGYDPVDHFPLACNFGACVFPESPCVENVTKEQCEGLGGDFVPMSTCGPKQRGGRCGAMCRGALLFLLLVTLGVGGCGCCTGCFVGFLTRLSDPDDDERKKQ